ncbi:hypothetical protein KC19_11G028000 [Ceratodon purpureus]|uniref:Uncharacterized protein n=1 Tax=Ceratodon purpureus TaxID=3225 RepID=A0A8T0GCN6_CERPU|nr:hypothetical protein KC19_11G028000 [Ceratodon purpureus]
MVTQAFLGEWPLERLGNYKYWVYAPFLFKLYLTTFRGALPESDNWYLYMFGLIIARYAVQQFWNTITRLHAVTRTYEIHRYAVDFEQVDREDNHMMLQFLFFSVAHSWFPGFSNFTSGWNSKGLLWVLLFHVGPTECLYYWVHRIFHIDALYKKYHSFHHLSVVPEPPTGFITTMLEQMLQSLLVCIPLLGAAVMGTASMGLIYVYVIAFDFLKCVGHSNFEFVPTWLHNLPGAKYLVYTPSYHSLHHTEQRSNFCLFMPLYDYLGGTVDPKTDSVYAELRKGIPEEVPEFVFLAHCIDLLSSLQVSFMFRTLAAHPYEWHWFLWPFLLPGLCILCMFWIFADTFVAHKYCLYKLRCMAWVVPRHGFQYFLPFGLDGINKFIENSILDADAKGVKVLSLAALNKNEALNGGGLLFVKKHPNLRVRVVHGNTLTAAVIIKTLPRDVKEVFMNGATSKLGRAIALYLCCRGIRVLMLTSSNERFESIQREASPEFRKNLIRVTKYQAGKHCKTWIVGKWTWAKDQQWAPPGTHFHQFVVPPISPLRTDCTYGMLAGMLLPASAIKGMRTCEMNMQRHAVHACHAGGLIHALEGWTHHEVGSIDVQRIDIVWDAAMRNGFSPIA